jgi:hypothetical protein
MSDKALWEVNKERARKLTRDELVRNALVARQNRHSCMDCFLCACVVVLGEIRSIERQRAISGGIG